RLLSRNGNDLAHRFPTAVAAIAALPARSCVIDGEAIVCDESGLAVFDLVRGRVTRRHWVIAELCRLHRPPKADIAQHRRNDRLVPNPVIRRVAVQPADTPAAARLIPRARMRCSRSGYARPSCRAAVANSSLFAISGLGFASRKYGMPSEE